MNIPPEINLVTFHTNAVAAIAAKFGSDVAVVAAYPRFEQKIPPVAITIELDGFTPANPDDIGTEQFQAELRFAAYIFVSYLEDDYKLKVRILGARLGGFLYGKRFGCPVSPGRGIVGSPDDIELPGKSGRDGDALDYEVWRVEWTHDALMGESVWDDEGAVPVEVWTINNGEETQLA